MGLENISFQSFKSMVDNAKVLDGNLALMATDKKGGVDLVKVDFGGSLRKVFSAAAEFKVDGAPTNAALRERFYLALTEEVTANGVISDKAIAFLKSAREMLGLDSAEAKAKPLSRMTVKLLVDQATGAQAKKGEVSVGGANFTMKQLNAFLSRVETEAKAQMLGKGVTADQLATKMRFLRSELSGLPDNREARQLAEIFTHDLETKAVAESLLDEIARENMAGAMDEAEIDASNYQFAVPEQKAPANEEKSTIARLRGEFNLELDAKPEAPKARASEPAVPKEVPEQPAEGQAKAPTFATHREAVLGKKDDAPEVAEAKAFARTVIDAKVGAEKFEKLTAGKALTASFLLDLAEGLATGAVKVDDLSSYIANNDSTFVNSNEVRAMMADPKVQANLSKVTMPAPQRSDAEKLRNFAADLAFSEDTWIYDGGMSGADRMRSVLTKHIDVLSDLVTGHQSLALMPLEPEMEIALKELVEKLKSNAGLKAALENTADLKPAADLIKSLDARTLEGIEQRIVAAGDLACRRQQEELTEMFARFLGGGDKMSRSAGGAHEAPELDHRSLSLDAPADRLDSFISGGGKGITGGRYGKFLVKSLDTYFKSIPMMDKRAMFASSLRYAAIPEQKLAAFFKGAGPVFQKMLQGLPAGFGDAKFRAAIADMKSRLAPIPAEIVKTQLADIITQSGGKITAIRVDKSLGAATVGQAFLCTITDDKGAERKGVVKLLRPDAKLRALREKDVFMTAATKVPGMTEMFKSQFSGIMSELDLRKEAANIEKGNVYNTTGAKLNVGAMKLDTAVKPTSVSMVVEQAEGTTVDRLVDKVQKQVRAALEKLVYVNDAGEIFRKNSAENSSGKGFVVFKDTGMKCAVTFSEVQKVLNDSYEQIRLAQAGLVNASKVWTQEALFGGGVIHGDMHSGNIMVKGDKVTIIDFGNATEVDDKDKKSLVAFSAATAFREPGDVITCLTKMMDPDNPQVAKLQAAAKKYEFLRTNPTGEPPAGVSLADNEYDAVMEDLHEALNLGEDMDDAGRRMTAALKILQNAGVEIPAKLVTFMQSQDRLEASVNSLNDLMRSIREAYETITENTPVGKIHEGATSDIHLQLMKALYEIESNSDTDPIAQLDEAASNGSSSCFASNEEYPSSLMMSVLQAFGAKDGEAASRAILQGGAKLSVSTFKDFYMGGPVLETQDGTYARKRFLTVVAPLIHHNPMAKKMLQEGILDKLDTLTDETFTQALIDFSNALIKEEYGKYTAFIDVLLKNADKLGLVPEASYTGDSKVTMGIRDYEHGRDKFGNGSLTYYVVTDVEKFNEGIVKLRDSGAFGPKPVVNNPDFKNPKDYFDGLSDVIQNNKLRTMGSIGATLGSRLGTYSKWALKGKEVNPQPVKMRP